MQKIDNIEIKNFKSIRHQKIEGCKRVNVFIGYPNVGKSNILEALSLLTFIRQRHPDLLKGLIRFEKLTQLFNYFNIQNPAIIELNETYSLKIEYMGEDALKINLNDGKNNLFDLSLFGLTGGDGRFGSSFSAGVDNFTESFKELQYFNVKPYKFSSDKVFSESYSALDLKIPYGRNLFELIANNSDIQKEFSELLKPYGLDIVIDASNNEVKISPPIKNGIIQTIPISLMSETLVRLIFFKTAIISNKNSILLFEEPEAHMFPPYIAQFTTDIIFDENDNQYFIATHSPFVLNNVFEDMDLNELSIYVVGLNNGETFVRRLNDDEISEINQYGIDLFFNLESYLKDGFVNNA